jgi:hypothetical protein
LHRFPLPFLFASAAHRIFGTQPAGGGMMVAYRWLRQRLAPKSAYGYPCGKQRAAPKKVRKENERSCDMKKNGEG